MIANLLASAVDGQRVELKAVVATRGAQTTSKAGTPKRALVLTDASGSIELTLLCEGAVMSETLARGDTVVLTNAKVGVWNGNASLLMFTAPLVHDDTALRSWWLDTGSKVDSMPVQTILNLPDQKIVNNVIGLVVSTEEASATKSGGIKRKFTIADGSTAGSIEVCFAGKHAAAKPQYAVGSVVIMASARVGVWQDTRSLLIFDPPACTADDDAATRDIQAWIRAGGAAMHQPLSLREMCATADDQRVDLRPVVVSSISDRTMTAGGSLWKRTIEIADETTGGAGVEICTIGAAAETALRIGDVIGIKRAKVCSYNGKRGAIVFDAPGRVADDGQMVAWWATRKQSNDGVGFVPAQTKLSHVPRMVDGTRVGFASVVVINERSITDRFGFKLGVTFTAPLAGRFIRIDDATVRSGELVVSAFTEIIDTALAVWWEGHEDNDLPHAKDAPPSPVGDWPF